MTGRIYLLQDNSDLMAMEEAPSDSEELHAHDAGAKRVLLPMASVGDIPTIPGELFAKFQTGFYSDPRDAAFKALGVE